MNKVITANNQSEKQLKRLANLLLLQSRCRDAKTEMELSFTIVNDTLSLVSATTALLWQVPESGNFRQGALCAVSASPLPEKNTPFSRWAKSYCLSLNAQMGDVSQIVGRENVATELSSESQQFVANESIWLPLVYRNKYLGALVLFRDLPWTESELRILQQWSASVAHAWFLLRYAKEGLLQRVRSSSQPRILAAVTVMLLLVMLVPVRLSVLAPAEVKSRDSILVRSPIRGVIDKLFVTSNDSVQAGQLLLKMDDTALTTELEVTRQELEIIRARFRQSSQAAVYSEEAKAELQVFRITLAKTVAEVNYLSELLARTLIRAPEDSIVIIENSDTLIGRPVQLGERLLTLVNNNNLEIELWLPVGDDIQLDVGSAISFFPNVAPEDVYEGKLLSMEYEAQVSPLGTLAYRARASILIPQDSYSRIGMRGTAKLYGSRVSLFYYLFRRPIAFVRQNLGL